MDDIQTVSIAIASAGVLVAAVYYVLHIRHQNRMRQTDLVMRLYSTFGSREVMEAYARILNTEFENYSDFMDRYGQLTSEKPIPIAFNMLGHFFEGIGVLLHRRLIAISLVDDLFTAPIKLTWEKMKPIVEGFRKQIDLPTPFEWFEYLYNEMKKREQRGVKSG